jgi:glycosyltransferase involved in cell wall biosynthesis
LSRHKNRSAPIVVPNAILPPYDGLDIDLSSASKPKIPADAFVFGSVGRLSVEKGHRYLLDAFAQLSSSLPAAHLRLMLLGEGRELPVLEAQAQRLGIADKVVFAGFQRDCSAWMQSMHCLVQPSLTEGTPNSVLEALHYRLPIVATAVGGVPEVIIDQQNGLLVPPRSAEALAVAMREVFQSSELRERFAAGADHIMSEYAPAVQRERLIAVYKTALQTSRPRGAIKEVERDAA